MKAIQIFLFFLATACFADESRDPSWEVFVNDSVCVARLRVEVVRLDDPATASFGYYVLGDFSIGRSHTGTESRITKLLSANSSDQIIQVQLVPNTLSHKGPLTISDVRIDSDSAQFAMTPDSEWDHPELPVYYIAGKGADRIWSDILSDKNVSIKVVITGSDRTDLSLPVNGKFLQPVARMYAACADYMSHNKSLQRTPQSGAP